MIIALDPGETIGWAADDGRGTTTCGQLVPTEDYGVWEFLDLAKPMALVVEKVQVPGSRSISHSPIECTGIIKEWARQNHVLVILQTPGLVKSYFTNERLKEFGLYERGKPHAMDALRHLLYYTRRFVPNGKA